MIVLYILYALVGISIIIFLHEAGHFLAAKKVGVRVERFALGFDPPFRGRNLRFFSFRRGETEYVLGMIPFGGYVKLAGESLAEPGLEPAPDELLAKPVGSRALIFVAGSAMNVVSAFIFFMAAFTLGVPFPEPQVGLVVPGSPAWEAGIQPGDTVVAVDGDEVVDFTEMKIAVILGKRSQPVQLSLTRPAGEAQERLDVSVTPRWDPEAGFSEIGVQPAYSSILDAPPPGSAFEKAGVRAGDALVGLELGGERLPPLPANLLVSALGELGINRPAERFRVEVERDGQRQWIEIVPHRMPGKKAPPILGVRPEMRVVHGVQAGSAAAGTFRPGEELIAVNGKEIAGVHWLTILEETRGAADREMEFELLTASGERRKAAASRKDFITWSLRGDIFWDAHTTLAGDLPAGSALLAAGIRKGDTIIDLNGAPCFAPGDIPGILSRDASPVFAARVLRGSSRETLSLPRSALAEHDKVTWITMPPLLIIPGLPASAAGIAPGSRIERIGKETIRSWADLIAAVGRLERESKLEVSWRTRAGEEKQGVLSLAGHEMMDPPGLAVEVLQKTVRAGPLESFALGGQRTIISAKQIFLQLRSLIRRDVSAKHLSGPVGITHFLTRVAKDERFSTLIYILAIISINLGLFNLLPFPILDGGHLLFLGIEKVKGSPVSVAVQEWAMKVAFLMIILLAVFVTFNDIRRLLG